MAQDEGSKMKQPEVWMRGPIEGIPALLQPVAHALLQAAEEIEWTMNEFPDHLLWEKPAGMASAGFHLQHIPGVLDRLFTYAAGQQLSSEQLKYLSEEGLEEGHLDRTRLVRQAVDALHTAVKKLHDFEEATLTEFRGVGRKKLPSTVIGLLFHAAEHTMRHVGQLIVTVGVVRAVSGER